MSEIRGAWSWGHPCLLHLLPLQQQGVCVCGGHRGCVATIVGQRQDKSARAHVQCMDRFSRGHQTQAAGRPPLAFMPGDAPNAESLQSLPLSDSLLCQVVRASPPPCKFLCPEPTCRRVPCHAPDPHPHHPCPDVSHGRVTVTVTVLVTIIGSF
jgi:hypothetical protein